MVMFFETVPQRIGTNCQGQRNHADLKTGMVDDIDTKQRKSADK